MIVFVALTAPLLLLAALMVVDLSKRSRALEARVRAIEARVSSLVDS